MMKRVVIFAMAAWLSSATAGYTRTRGGSNYFNLVQGAQIDRLSWPNAHPVTNWNSTHQLNSNGVGVVDPTVCNSQGPNWNSSQTWSECVRYQLSQMAQNGQRALRIPIWFSRNFGKQCVPGSSEEVMEYIRIGQTESSEVPAPCLDNLQNFLVAVRQYGFEEVELGVFSSLDNDPYNWGNRNVYTDSYPGASGNIPIVQLMNENVAVARQLRNVARYVQQQTGLNYYIDLGNETAPYLPQYNLGALSGYIQYMWSQYITGNPVITQGEILRHTVGFSVACGLDCDQFLSRQLPLYGGIYPWQIDVHIYYPPSGTTSPSDAYSKAMNTLNSFGLSSTPFIIGEASYDTNGGAAEAAELDQIDRTYNRAMFVLQFNAPAPTPNPPYTFTNWISYGW